MLSCKDFCQRKGEAVVEEDMVELWGSDLFKLSEPSGLNSQAVVLMV